MGLYTVSSLDVQGNPVDGFEINDTRELGEVYIAPPREEIGFQDPPRVRNQYETSIFKALADAEFIGDHGGELEIEFDDEGGIDVNEQVRCFRGVLDRTNVERFIEMAPPPDDNNRGRWVKAETAARAQLEDGEELEVVEGFMPILHCESQILHGGGPVVDQTEFFRIKKPRSKRDEAQRLAFEFSAELRRRLSPEDMAEVVRRNAGEIDDRICHSGDFCDSNVYMAAAFETIFGREFHPFGPDADDTLWNEAWGIAKEWGFNPPYDVEIILGYDSGRLGIEVRACRAGSPHIHPGVPDDVTDRFEWDLADWQRHPTLGFNPADSEELKPTKKQLGEILVALDRYLETHS